MPACDTENSSPFQQTGETMLISACGSDTLLGAHAPVFDKYLRYLMIAGIYRGEITAREHQTLLDCALRRDAATAIGVLKVHIEACVDFTLAIRLRIALRLAKEDHSLLETNCLPKAFKTFSSFFLTLLMPPST